MFIYEICCSVESERERVKKQIPTKYITGNILKMLMENYLLFVVAAVANSVSDIILTVVVLLLFNSIRYENKI